MTLVRSIKAALWFVTRPARTRVRIMAAIVRGGRA